MQTVKTWLPVFPGFYGTIFEPSEDSEIEYINQKRKRFGLESLYWEQFDFDYEDYYQSVVHGCIGAVESELVDFVSKIELEKLNSPREYNFANDSIDCTIELSVENIINFLQENIEAFSKYLERYTSRSGFISWYSDDVDDWMADLDDTLTDAHKLGAVLQFICDCQGFTEESLYDWVMNDCLLSVTNDCYQVVMPKEILEYNPNQLELCFA